jgi:hypothetical protein
MYEQTPIPSRRLSPSYRIAPSSPSFLETTIVGLSPVKGSCSHVDHILVALWALNGLETFQTSESCVAFPSTFQPWAESWWTKVLLLCHRRGVAIGRLVYLLGGEVLPVEFAVRLRRDFYSLKNIYMTPPTTTAMPKNLALVLHGQFRPSNDGLSGNQPSLPSNDSAFGFGRIFRISFAGCWQERDAPGIYEWRDRSI